MVTEINFPILYNSYTLHQLQSRPSPMDQNNGGVVTTCQSAPCTCWQHSDPRGPQCDQSIRVIVSWGKHSPPLHSHLAQEQPFQMLVQSPSLVCINPQYGQNIILTKQFLSRGKYFNQPVVYKYFFNYYGKHDSQKISVKCSKFSKLIISPSYWIFLMINSFKGNFKLTC